MKIDVDKIREVIGKGGSMIQKIVAESGAQVDIDDDGTMLPLLSPDAASCDAAKKMIDDICFVPAGSASSTTARSSASCPSVRSLNSLRARTA